MKKTAIVAPKTGIHPNGSLGCFDLKFGNGENCEHE